MATTDYDDELEPSRAEQIASFFGTAVSTVTDTGASSGVALRTFLLLILVGLCVVLAPWPANVVGVAAVIALALSTAASHRGLR